MTVTVSTDVFAVRRGDHELAAMRLGSGSLHCACCCRAYQTRGYCRAQWNVTMLVVAPSATAP